MLKTTATETMADGGVPYVLDVHAVLAWSEAAGNEHQIVRRAIEGGTALVFGRVWNDFCDAYPDHAQALRPEGEFPRPRMLKAHRLSAAALTECAGDAFAPAGPYDDCSDLVVAAISRCQEGTVVTSAERAPVYEAIDGISALSYEDFLDIIG